MWSSCLHSKLSGVFTWYDGSEQEQGMPCTQVLLAECLHRNGAPLDQKYTHVLSSRPVLKLLECRMAGAYALMLLSALQ